MRIVEPDRPLVVKIRQGPAFQDRRRIRADRTMRSGNPATTSATSSTKSGGVQPRLPQLIQPPRRLSPIEQSGNERINSARNAVSRQGIADRPSLTGEVSALVQQNTRSNPLRLL